MDMDEKAKAELSEEVARIQAVTQRFYVEHGRYPIKIRTGAGVRQRLHLPTGAGEMRLPIANNCPIVLDEALGTDDIVADG